MGRQATSRTDCKTAMIPTYTSPPNRDRVLFAAICTALLDACMINPAVPRLTISRTRLPSSSSAFLRSRHNVRLPSRKLITHTTDSSWEITVAAAAPAMPICKTKIKMGSRMILAMAPIKRVAMPVFPNPWALINPFIPVTIIIAGVPIR